jgi:hypothetical protein
MPYSIQLRFDPESESKILSFSKALNDLGIADPEQQFSSMPHIALGVFQELDVDRTKAVLDGLALKRFPLLFASLATFAGTENVVFLSPLHIPELYVCHQTIHENVSTYSLYNDHYQPGGWIPHCTVGIEIPEDRFGQAFQHLKARFSPLSVNVERLCVTRFRPSEVIYERTMGN